MKKSITVFGLVTFLVTFIGVGLVLAENTTPPLTCETEYFFMGHLGKHYYMDTEAVNKYFDQVNRGLLPIAKLFVSPIEAEMRKMMMRLAIRLPIEKNKFYERFGKIPEDEFPVVINRLKRKGLIEVDDRELRLTKLGDIWRYNVACEFGP